MQYKNSHQSYVSGAWAPAEIFIGGQGPHMVRKRAHIFSQEGPPAGTHGVEGHMKSASSLYKLHYMLSCCNYNQ